MAIASLTRKESNPLTPTRANLVRTERADSDAGDRIVGIEQVGFNSGGKRSHAVGLSHLSLAGIERAKFVYGDRIAGTERIDSDSSLKPSS